MKRERIAWLVMVCICVLLYATMALAAQQNYFKTGNESKGNLVVNISTDNVELMYAAIRIAMVAAQRGHGVTLLLRVRAIDFALKNSDFPVYGTTIKQELKNFMKTGSQVIVGGGCLKLRGIAQTELMDDIIIGNPDIVMGALFRENTRILSY